MTRALYYEDPRLAAFEARLVGERRAGGRWAVVLDRTGFYPQGGGQPADRGSLNGLPVLDVQQEGAEVVHYLPAPLELAAGAPVRGEVDAGHRFEYMQQHTGQHIISGALWKAAGAYTLSAHLGETDTTVEVDSPRVAEEKLLEAEELANRVIRDDLPVRALWVEPQDIHRFPLRKPPPARERIRVVDIGGFDCTACSGLHLERTGLAVLVHRVGEERIRGHHRLHWKIGERALRDYREKDRAIALLTRELSSGLEEIAPAVRRLKEQLRGQALSLARAEERLAENLAESLLERGRAGPGRYRVLQRFAGESPALVRRVFERLLERPGTVAALLLEEGGKLQWLVGQSPAGPAEGGRPGPALLPLKEVLPPLLPLIGGKGGGNELRWQGAGREPAGGREFLRALEERIRRHWGERDRPGG